MNNNRFEQLALLERTGALRLLVALMEGRLYISEIIRRGEGHGLASQPAIEKTRTALVKLALIEENEVFIELTRKTRLYLSLTEKGREVAKAIRRVAHLLSES